MYAFVDECWNNLICGVIGGTILPSSMITGIRLLDRMSSPKSALIRIEVWFTDSAHLSKDDKKILDEKFNGDCNYLDLITFLKICPAVSNYVELLVRKFIKLPDKRLMSELWQNIETAMLTRLDGSYDCSQKCWEESQPNMHSKK